jgi:Kef-type K+ transport system membrane component KefB
MITLLVSLGAVLLVFALVVDFNPTEFPRASDKFVAVVSAWVGVLFICFALGLVCMPEGEF